MGITIGISFYNAEKFLADAIRSVFAQTYKDWELILIDDGSTDRSLEIAKSIQDPRVRVYSDGKNKKLAARLNELAQLAKYDVIARMDADDLMATRRLELQMEVLNLYPRIDLVSTGVFSITDDLKLIGYRYSNNKNISFKDVLFQRSGIVHAAILGRKEWFLRNPYNISLMRAQDYDLWLHSSLNNDLKIFLIKEPLYFYREEDNVTALKLLKAYRIEREMYSKYAGKYFILLVLKSYLKSLVTYILSKLNKTNLLLNKRNLNVLDSKLLQFYIKEIEAVKKVKLCGLIE